MSAPAPVAPSILLLDGDAEARLLADAGTALQAVFAGRETSLRRTWSTRPDWLDPAGPVVPRAFVESGALPEADVRPWLDDPQRLVVYSLLPAVTLPAMWHRDGGAFLAPRGVRAGWSREVAARIAAECTEEPPMTPEEASAALEPLIARLQDRGVAVAVCTAFRHVRATSDAEVRSLRETIRRLNLSVARLSQRTGCFVLDLDRPLAHEGGAALDADCFGGEGRAAEIALDEFAALLLDALPDDIMSLEFS